MEKQTGAAVTRLNSATRSAKHSSQSSDRRIDGLTREVGERLGELSTSIRDTASEYMNQGKEYVAENPLKGVAMAAAAGALIGSAVSFLIRRRG